MIVSEKIALVNMCYPKDRESYAPPLGLLSIASYLKQFGIESCIYDVALDVRCEAFTVDVVTDYFHSIEERVIGISTWDSVLTKIVLSVQKLKQTKDKIVILGGPTATNLSTRIIEEFPCIDYCVEGEGEKAMLNLLNWLGSQDSDLSLLSTKIIGRKGNSVFRGTFKEDFFDAKDIPIIDYELCDVEKYSRFDASSTRGCPFRCEFCSINSTLDNQVRIRPMEHVFEELDNLFRSTNCDTVNFVDDNFGLYDTRLGEFCQLFQKRFPDKSWTCYFRISDLTKENVDLMVDSGCVGVFIGIETGNKDKLIELDKGIDREELLTRIKYATTKFDVTASFIWGFPDEDEYQLLDTFDVISQITEYDNIIVDLYQLAPLSGTPLTSRILDNLEFNENAISGFVFPPYIPELSKEEKELMREYPQIFSAFYHENTERFGNKYHMVNKFLGERTC